VTFRKVLVAAVAALTVVTAPRAGHAQTPIQFSGAVGLGLPVGNLGDAANVGFNLAVRGEGQLGSSPSDWGLRGDLSLDQLGGKGGLGSVSFWGAAANMVHRSHDSRLYEFGGLGLYDFRVSGGGLTKSEMDLGLQVGVGYNLSQGPHATFLEFGLINVFATGSSELWFPLRFGIRF
jgi:hypothetical protein